jgi:ABC-2 type transport system permease protein
VSALFANARVVAELGRRSVRQTARRPQLAAPLLIFPTLLLAVQVGGAGRAVDLPQFPQVNGFLDFMLAGAMVQGTLMAGNSGAIAFAIDMEMGFTDRLMAAPISRFAIVLGRLAGTAMVGALIGVYFIALGLIFGAEIQEGVLGAIWIVIVVAGSAVAFGAIGISIALRTGTASVVQGLFPLLFVILFLSNAFFPINLLLEPSATIAEYNPLSFIVDGLREPIVASFSATDSAAALASVLGIAAFGMWLCAAAIRARARRGG